MNIFHKLQNKHPLRTLGIMSGTSMDGVDFCVADVNIPDDSVKFTIVANRTITFSPGLRDEIQSSLAGTTEQICKTHYRLGRFYAEKTDQFLSESSIREVDVVGMHGQTIHHISGEATLQIGEPSFLAEKLGIPIISDFRARDISAGGTGAPLIPIVDKWIFQREYERFICLNIGGIANVTYLPSKESNKPIFGFDTGPGMSLLDEAISRSTGKKYDESGETAQAGVPFEETVQKWMEDDFISRVPPKSTGRDYFGIPWLETYKKTLINWSLEDLLATLSLFTARSVALNCQRFIGMSEVKNIIVSGGGVHHACVMDKLSREFSPIPVVSSEEYRIDPDYKEALGMAMLAAAYIKGIPGNIPSVTGASHPVILGKLTL